MDFFGKPWPSRNLDGGLRVAVPVGQECAWCTVPFEDGDRGLVETTLELTGVRVLYWHRECYHRSAVGSPAHLDGRCRCNGHEEPPGPRTPAERRAEAQGVWERTVGRVWD